MTPPMPPGPAAACAHPGNHSSFDGPGRPQSGETSNNCRTPSNYEAAVQRLNLLQSNAATVQLMKERRESLQHLNVPETADCLRRAGIELSSLDSLHIVHVTGTKGKGSTCAYAESILRRAGLRTGFFSSPHMIHVRERIRVNGRPLEEDEFAEALFRLHDKLNESPPSDPRMPPMPAYFKFLTVLAFEVFLREKVDVAIVEVGIGGEYDCTNVIRRPVVCGVATLDLDHTALLGHSLPEIAWNKAGIFKPAAIVLASEEEDEEAMAVLRARAAEREVASFATCPPLSAYTPPSEGGEGGQAGLRVGIPGEHQKANVSLALQLSRAWLRSQRPEIERSLFGEAPWQPGEPFAIPRLAAEAVAECEWPGRSQRLEALGCRFFLDGAHTPKSMQSCVRWFVEASQEQMEERPLRVLLFHCTGDRRPEALLQLLQEVPLDAALLCPPLVAARPPPTSDAANFYRPPDEQTRQSAACEAAWRELRPEVPSLRFECLSSALDHIARLREQRKVDVLVTGSLILVGNVLSALGQR